MGDLPRGISRRRGRYRVQVGYKGTTHHLGDFESLQVARDVLRIARGDIARGQFVPPSERRELARAERQRQEEEAQLEESRATTVAQWVQEWTSAHKCSEGTRTSYRSLLRRHVLPTLGDKRLWDVTQEDVDELLESLPTTATRYNVARCLRPMLKAAHAAGMVESVPSITTPKVKARTEVDPERLATLEQVRAIADHMPPRLALAVPLAALCALRAGEVLGLQRRDFTGLEDAEGATVHVRRQLNSKTPGGASYTSPKAGSYGEVAVPAALVPTIVAHMAAHVSTDPEAPVFPSSRDRARPTSPTAFDGAYRAAVRAAGCEGITFHDLRRTSLTLYAQAGATLAEIMARGRHKDVAVSQRYQYATRARDRANTERMSSGW